MASIKDAEIKPKPRLAHCTMANDPVPSLADLRAEIADFVRYIASNAVNLATGSVFTVDGGLSIRS
jgi:enoyl-[acyl-carrier-protein] reductase (NADH)